MIVDLKQNSVMANISTKYNLMEYLFLLNYAPIKVFPPNHQSEAKPNRSVTHCVSTAVA